MQMDRYRYIDRVRYRQIYTYIHMQIYDNKKGWTIDTFGDMDVSQNNYARKIWVHTLWFYLC